MNETEKQIVVMLKQYGMAAGQLILASGLPGGSRTQRVKAAAFADGYAKAVAQIKDAIEHGKHRQHSPAKDD